MENTYDEVAIVRGRDVMIMLMHYLLAWNTYNIELPWHRTSSLSHERGVTLMAAADVLRGGRSRSNSCLGRVGCLLHTRTQGFGANEDAFDAAGFPSGAGDEDEEDEGAYVRSNVCM